MIKKKAGTRIRRVPRKAILVLGMHRSGTSALTRVLSLLGADLPKNLPQAAFDNETGFWESQDLILAHDELLGAMGSAWDDIRPYSKDWLRNPAVQIYQDRIAAILDADFRDSSLFVVKDPRICRFVPLWLSVLEKIRVAPLVVLPYRNPFEVAESLAKRNEFSMPKSLLLWLRHVVDAEIATRSFPRAIVAYEELLWDWEKTTDKIAKDLKITWPKKGRSVNSAIEKFVDGRYRHSVFSRNSVLEDSDVVKWVRDVYAALLAARSGSDVSFERVVSRVAKELAIADQAFRPLLEENIVALRNESSKVVEAHNILRETQAAVADRDTKIGALAQEFDAARDQFALVVGQKDADLVRIGTEHAQRSVQIQQIETELLGLRDLVAQRQAAAEKLALQIQERNLRIEELQLQADSQQKQAVQSNEELQRLALELQTKEQGLLAQNEITQAQREEIAQLTAVAEQAALQMQERNLRIEELQLQADSQQKQAVQSNEEIAHLTLELQSKEQALLVQSQVTQAQREEITKLNNAVRQAALQIQERNQRVEELQRQADEQQKQVVQVNEELQRLTQELRTKEQDLLAQGQVTHAQRDEIVSLTATIRELTSSVKDKEQRLLAQACTTELQNEMLVEFTKSLVQTNALVQQFAVQVRDRDLDNTALNKRVDQLIVDIATKENQLDHYKQQFEMTLGEVGTLKSEVHQLVDAVSERQELVNRLESERADDRRSIDFHKAVSRQLTDSLFLQNQQVDEFKNKVAVQNQELTKLNEAASRMLGDIHEREQRITEIQHAANKQFEELVGLKGLVTKLEADVGARDAALTDISKVLQPSGDVSVELLSAQIANVQKTLLALRNENSQLQKQLMDERYTVVRPALRSGFRLVKKLARSLSPKPRAALRRCYYEVATLIAPSGSHAQQWLDFKRATQPSGQNVSREVTSSTGEPTHAPSRVADADEQLVLARQVPDAAADIVIFPIIDWHFRIQRAQHLATRLAQKGHRVFYLATTFLEAQDAPHFELVESPAPNVFLAKVSCCGAHPVIYSGRLAQEQLAWVSQAIESLRDAVGRRTTVAVLHLPFWTDVAQRIPGSTLVYDCMDYHAGFSNVSLDLVREEQRLLKEADVVVTTSAALSEHVGQVRRNVLIRNAAEVEFFATKPEVLAISATRPTVGYYGAISDWFDSATVAEAAKAYPGWDFILVGSTAGADIRELQQLSNVQLVGEVPYRDLPGFLHAFDVCMIPFKLNELIMHTNPVKLYEYLSAGKPVVAAMLPELVSIDKDLVYLAASSQEFVDKLGSAMHEKNIQGLIKKRKGWVKQHTWAERADRFDDMLSSVNPKISVVVLCYNNLQFTKDCLASLEKNTRYKNWELVIVDNASSDGTREYLTQYQHGRPHVKLSLNRNNLGFSGGNNVGLRMATGDYLVLLNNDTYVTDGWLLDLVRPLRKNAEIGLVGPVTNNIGNEAKIDIDYKTWDEMELKAREYTSSRKNSLFLVETVAFFCVAFSRKLISDVGFLDEQFEIGFFEDDDYCKRTRNAGYKVAINDGAFVHHHLSASFNALAEGRKKELFEKNKQVYERKWGRWVPHQYRRREEENAMVQRVGIKT